MLFCLNGNVTCYILSTQTRLWKWNHYGITSTFGINKRLLPKYKRGYFNFSFFAYLSYFINSDISGIPFPRAHVTLTITVFIWNLAQDYYAIWNIPPSYLSILYHHSNPIELQKGSNISHSGLIRALKLLHGDRCFKMWTFCWCNFCNITDKVGGAGIA
jgi:hypothetical protein